jgi:FixJ family two-component response regulator
VNKVYVVEDDEAVRDGLAALLESEALDVVCYAHAEAFLADFQSSPSECLVLDMRMPGMSGLELQSELERRGAHIPIIFLTAHGDIPTSVRAIKAGAVDFLTKPIDASQLLERIRAALQYSAQNHAALTAKSGLRERVMKLTEREREVLALAIAGLQNKDIARKLGISYRTVEIHRAHVLRKTGVRSLVDLARLENIFPPGAPR